LKWIGDRRVSNEKEIKNAVAAVASRVPASNGYVVESVRVAMTFLTVPATMVEAGFRSKEETLGYKTIVCHFFPNDSEHEYLKDGGFKVKGRDMNNYLEIQSDRKVKVDVLMGFPTYSTIGRISKEWTLDAIDEKWTYTVSDQAGMLQHLLASIGENKSRKIPLKFCTDLKKGCGVGYFFQDMKSWERDIMLLETKEVEVEVVDKDESYVGKVETVEASKNEIVVSTDDPHAKGHRKQIFLTMPDDASRIKRIVSVKDVEP
jgi:hypothetical protein